MIVAFDIYGTLLDVASLTRALSPYTDRPSEFLTLWRAKQLEYAFMYAAMGKYEPFSSITRRALMYTARRMGVTLTGNEADMLVEAWTMLEPYPDVEALGAIREHRLVALTNGDRDMVDRTLGRTGVGRYLDGAYTSDMAGTFKPSPRIYRLVEEGSLLVSSNPWDIAGAHHAGLRTCYLDRHGLPMEELDVRPTMVVRSLYELHDALRTLTRGSAP